MSKTAEKSKQESWTPSEIPGLVKKKKAASTPEPEVKKELAVVEELEVCQPEADTAPTNYDDMSVADFHKELLNLLYEAKASTQKLELASEVYYTLCEFVETGDVVDRTTYIMSKLQNADPDVAVSMLANAADEIVCAWKTLGTLSDKAQQICNQLKCAADSCQTK